MAIYCYVLDSTSGYSRFFQIRPSFSRLALPDQLPTILFRVRADKVLSKDARVSICEESEVSLV